MAIQVPFPIPSSGYALNSKLRVNLDFIVSKFNEFNTGTATWDTVAVGTANNLTGTVTFYNSSNSNYLTLQAGVTSPSITYTLPTADGGSGYFLRTNGSGVMSWAQVIPDGLGAYLAMYDAATGVASNNLQAYKMYNSQFFRIAIADQGSLSSTRTYTIPNTGANLASFIMSEGSSSINGNLTMLAPGYLSTSILRFVNSVTCEISMASGGSGHSLIWPSSQGAGGTVLSNNGSGTLSWATIGSLGGVATTALNNLAAVAINTSLVSDTDNTDSLGSASILWANTHSKAFTAGRSGSLGSLQLFPTTASKGWIWINASNNAGDTELLITNASMAGTRAYTIPDAGTLSADFVLTAGSQIVTGAKTFASSALLLQEAGSTDVVTIAVASLGAGRTYTVPDAGGAASFVMTEGTQTINGSKTFGADFLCERSNVGNRVTGTVKNTDNTDGGSNARITAAVGGSSGGDPFFFCDNGVTDWAFGTDNSDSDKFKLSQASSVGTNDVIVVTSAGEVTQPLQPSFLATAPANTANVTGDGTLANAEYDTEIFDQGSDFDTSTFTFTTPITGRYCFSATLDATGISAGATFSEIQIVTSNREYRFLEPQVTVAAAETMITATVACADMDSNDTAIIKWRIGGTSKTAEMSNDARYNYFSGSLIN